MHFGCNDPYRFMFNALYYACHDKLWQITRVALYCTNQPVLGISEIPVVFFKSLRPSYAKIGLDLEVVVVSPAQATPRQFQTDIEIN